jgi:hypothetical protein
MIVFDVEADNLLEDATRIHCLSYTSDGKNYQTIFDYQEMRDFILIQKGLIGHNIVRYDVPLLEKILGIKVKARLFDTLPMSWVLNYERAGNKHGLAAFGEDFGVPKPEIDDWENLNPEDYAHRCVEDVKINWLLWRNLLKRFLYVYNDDKKLLDKFFRYLEFKISCAASAEFTGWKLDVGLARQCVDTLTTRKADKVVELKTVMPKRKVTTVKKKPKVCFKQDGSVSSHGDRWFNLLDDHNLPRHYDGEVTTVKGWDEPNPNSSDQVKDWLYSLGWKPCTFKYNKNKETGEENKVPQVRKGGELAESVKLLIKIDPAVAVLEGLTILQHRLSIFQGFLDCERDGYVKAEIDGLTNTLRFKHKKPLVNLPGVDKPWGEEVRGCLIAPEGYTLCGADMTSLEDTTKRHYMQPYDPAYVLEMSQDGFDPHLDLAKHAGRISQGDIDDYNQGTRPDIKSLRKNFKVVNYSATYGVGAPKLSRETGMNVREAQALLDAYWERNWSVKAFAEAQKIRRINGEMWVQNPVSKFWHSLRYEKDVFSTLNQSTGAYCFDKWVAYYRTRRPNIIGQFHDESINLVKKGDEDVHSTTLNWAIKKLNEDLKLNVDLGIDIQYGQKYSDVH